MSKRYKVGDRIVSVAGMAGTILRDVSAGQAAKEAYRVRWDNGSESVARPGFVIKDLLENCSLGARLGFQPLNSRTHGYNGQEHR